ncbi:FAD dependent oxidoreductase [Exophiala viscosa]|uniref:FAD dependent oxidoreductase n=1 Tax=Exophiala viscosa TaxID=2486360 RepID=UPI00219044C8|nr:FAD dependent oxidoreductase [Exophiala viscosa]
MSRPHPSPMTSYWLSYPSELSKHRTTETLPQEVDVAIIGSGYVGAATAHSLLEDEEDRPSVLILEARDACSGATGRNGGHLKPDVYFNAALYENTYGPDVAESLTKFETDQVFEVKRLVEKEEIDCDFELTRGIDVFTDPKVAEPTVKAYRRMKERGYKFPADLHFVSDPKKAERVSGVRGALCCYSYTAGTVWPYKLVSHLLRRCLSWGANLQTNTSVVSLGRSGSGWVVKTARGDVRAKKVVVAANAYTSSLLPEFAEKITPARGVACRIAVPEAGEQPPTLNNSYSIRYGPQEYDYLISRTDGSIVVGGAKQAVLLDDKYWRDNVDDSSLIPGAEKYFEGYMQRLFHGWEDSGAKVTDIWTGVMGYSADLMPWVGEVPGREGVFVVAGFTGHGMPRILGCSRAVAGLVSGKVKGVGEMDVPKPYHITEKRFRENRNVAREYMAGERPKLQ